jgi:hypothetical protein
MSMEQFGLQSFPTLQQSSYETLPSLAVSVPRESQAGVAEIGAAFVGRCWTAGGAGTRRFVASDLPLALQRRVQ